MTLKWALRAGKFGSGGLWELIQKSTKLNLSLKSDILVNLVYEMEKSNAAQEL